MRGSYCLVIDLLRDTSIDVGKLGRIRFSRGTYLYIGSAQNGIEARVTRHLRTKKRMHWHIDYLLRSRYAKVKEVFFKLGGKEDECITASRFDSGVFGFGSSDCRCASHLFRVNENFMKKLSDYRQLDISAP